MWRRDLFSHWHSSTSGTKHLRKEEFPGNPVVRTPCFHCQSVAWFFSPSLGASPSSLLGSQTKTEQIQKTNKKQERTTLKETTIPSMQSVCSPPVVLLEAVPLRVPNAFDILHSLPSPVTPPNTVASWAVSVVMQASRREYFPTRSIPHSEPPLSPHFHSFRLWVSGDPGFSKDGRG